MNLSAIFSKTGKGVQEASGKTSQLSRGDRTVLSAIDGKTTLAEVQKKFEKLTGPKFEALIQQLDKDGFIREVSSGAAQPAAGSARAPAAPSRAAPPPKAPTSGGDDEGLDFTQAVKLPPKAPPPAAPKPPPVDLAAAARAEAERKSKEQQAFDFRVRQEAEAKAKAEADVKAKAAAEARARAEAEGRARAEAEAKAREAAEAKGRADAEAKARADAESKARAEADTKTRAESDAKVKAAREAALRMAAEAKAKTDAAAEREREANERARKETEEKTRLEAELKGKLEEERKAREDAERRAREAADQTRREIEEKAKRDAEDLRQRLEAEMKAKLEEERKKREEEDRKRREEDQRRRKEEDERRAKEDAERRAREEADRKRREEEDRRRKEDDERRAKEDAERRAREEADKKQRDEEERQRRAKEESDRRAREEEDRKRRKEEDERRAKEDTDRRAKEDADRRSREEAERKSRSESEAKARASQSASFPAIEPVAPPPPPPPAAAGSDIGDSLLADLDSFTQREDEEAKAKEEAERKAKEEAARKAKAEAERRAKDDAERRAKEEADRKRREEEERREKEEAERKEKEEEEEREQEEAERKRKAKESQAARQAEEKAKAGAQRAGAAKKSAAAADDDIGVTDDDLDEDDIKRDEKVLAKTARKAALEQPSAVSVTAGRPKKWGKPVAIVLFVLLIGGIGLLQVMPISTAEYEKAASDAMGTPVKIGSARLSVITGVEVRFEGVSVGSAVKIGLVRGYPEIGSLFGATKAFSRIDLEKVSISQSQLADALLGKVAGQNFHVGRVVIKQAKFDGPLALPPLDVDAAVSGDGSLQSVTLRGGDNLNVTLSPKGNDIGFEISAGSLALPFVPALTLSEFSMKGTANRQGVTTSEFDGRVFDGVLSGTARIRWGANWNVEGELKARAVKVAVFAPALVSEGKVEGRGAYSMSGSTPASLFEAARVQGDFKIEQGVLGSFDLTRALQTGGAQTEGRTIFSELTGQGVYDKGAVQIRNVSVSAGAMSAGASLDIDAGGGLSGRVAAEVKAPTQTLRATLNLSGKVQDPVIRK